MSAPTNQQGADPGQPAAGLNLLIKNHRLAAMDCVKPDNLRDKMAMVEILDQAESALRAALSAPAQPPVVRESLTPAPIPAAPAAPVAKQPAIVSQYGRVHFLKCHPKPFAALKDEIKGFEYRSFDRDYQVGDLLMLQEWDPATADHTGFGLFRRVTYLISEGFGIPPGYCIMSVIPAHPGSVSTGESSHA